MAAKNISEFEWKL